MLSATHVSIYYLEGIPIDCLRGRGGRIALLPVVWKAATRIELGAAFFAVFERIDEAGLVMAGKVEDGFVEKAFLVVSLRHDCRKTAGRTIEAIVKFCRVFLRGR